MIYAALRGNQLTNNTIFDRNSPLNRDNCFAPYALLREEFLREGIEINTVDRLSANQIQFEIHQDVQNKTIAPINYLLMFENELVKVENIQTEKLAKYKKIFTWNDSMVDGVRVLKINFPNPITIHKGDGFRFRDRLCCMISGNRTLQVIDERILYADRVKVIRWFEKNARTEFDLYGHGWNMPAVRKGVIGKIERRFWSNIGRYIPYTPFPSYRGQVERKSDVLKNTKFSICYENVRDMPGYITEKLFDSFFSGCVPVYWGANNIRKYVPDDCFLDRRNYRDEKEMYERLKFMEEDEYIGYQERISQFLESEKAYPFGSEYFAETIVTTIVKDLENQA